MTEVYANSHKRRSSLETLVNPSASKPEGYFTKDEKDNKDEYNNENEHGEDAEVGNDLQDEAKYLLGDEGPNSTGDELEKGLPAEDADEDNESARHFSHGSYLVQGKLDHGMEDYIFTEHRNSNGYDLGLYAIFDGQGLYAIFDGHAGRAVARYLQGHLFDGILNEVITNEEACECVKDMDDAKKASKKLVKEALVQGSYDDIPCIVVMF